MDDFPDMHPSQPRILWTCEHSSCSHLTFARKKHLENHESLFHADPKNQKNRRKTKILRCLIPDCHFRCARKQELDQHEAKKHNIPGKKRKRSSYAPEDNEDAQSEWSDGNSQETYNIPRKKPKYSDDAPVENESLQSEWLDEHSKETHNISKKCNYSLHHRIWESAHSEEADDYEQETYNIDSNNLSCVVISCGYQCAGREKLDGHLQQIHFISLEEFEKQFAPFRKFVAIPGVQ